MYAGIEMPKVPAKPYYLRAPPVENMTGWSPKRFAEYAHSYERFKHAYPKNYHIPYMNGSPERLAQEAAVLKGGDLEADYSKYLYPVVGALAAAPLGIALGQTLWRKKKFSDGKSSGGYVKGR